MNTQFSNGFTAIELLVSLAVAAIVLTIGVPSFQNAVLDNRMTTQINELVFDLNFARSEAIKRGVPVTICKRNTAGTDCNSGGQWTDGWIIFSDLNDDGSFDGVSCQVGADCLLGVKAALVSGSTLTFSRNRVTFDTRGFAQGFNGTFTFCDSRGASKAKTRVLANTGRLTESTPPSTCP